jgi:hypothetical protein
VTQTIVDARIKKSRRTTFKDALYFDVLCGRQTVLDTYDCGGHLGRIWRLKARKDADLADPRSWSGGAPNFIDGVSISASALLDLAVDLRGCHVGETPDARHHQIWLAEHELGYRRLANGQYEVLPQRSPIRESERLSRTAHPFGEGYIERPVGHKPLPKDLAELVRSRGGAGDGTPLGLAAGGQGVVGGIPPIPSVIICPKCGARNQVLPLVFDERRGG